MSERFCLTFIESRNNRYLVDPYAEYLLHSHPTYCLVYHDKLQLYGVYDLVADKLCSLCFIKDLSDEVRSLLLSK